MQDTEKNETTQLVKNPCPNHEYRSRTKRMGQVAKYCALCMDQQEMAARWKKIRKALATIQRFTRKSSAAAKPASASAAKTQWAVSIVGAADPPALSGATPRGHARSGFYGSKDVLEKLKAHRESFQVPRQ